MPGILVGVDGSGHSQQALEWAAKHAALEHVPLTVLTVHELVQSPFTGNPVADAQDRPEVAHARKSVQEAVDKVVAALGDTRPESVSVRVMAGYPAACIIEASKDADLVVVGSRGIGGFAGLMTGSVTTKVVNHAESPVVIVRHK